MKTFYVHLRNGRLVPVHPATYCHEERAAFFLPARKYTRVMRFTRYRFWSHSLLAPSERPNQAMRYPLLARAVDDLVSR